MIRSEPASGRGSRGEPRQVYHAVAERRRSVVGYDGELASEWLPLAIRTPPCAEPRQACHTVTF
jgi:hypothetical protein